MVHLRRNKINDHIIRKILSSGQISKLYKLTDELHQGKDSVSGIFHINGEDVEVVITKPSDEFIDKATREIFNPRYNRVNYENRIWSLFLLASIMFSVIYVSLRWFY